MESETSFQIMPMQDTHVEQAGKLFYEVFGPSGCGEEWTEETSRQHVQENSLKRDFCWVAVVQEEVVGLLLAFPVVREHGTDLFVDSVAVRTDHQGKQIGKSLWSTMMDQAKEHGFKGVRLLAHPKYPSFQWYQRMGLVESGWVELAIRMNE